MLNLLFDDARWYLAVNVILFMVAPKVATIARFTIIRFMRAATWIYFVDQDDDYTLFNGQLPRGSVA